MLPVIQGRIGLVNAIRDLTVFGHTISVPLIDNQPYDLVADIGGVLNKISVKSTRTFTENNYPIVQIGDVRSNKNKNVIRKFDSSKVDYMYVYAIGLGSWLIPSKEIKTGRIVTLDTRYDNFKLNNPHGDIDLFPMW